MGGTGRIKPAVLGSRLLGTRMGSVVLKQGFSVLVTGYSDGFWCWVLERVSEKAGC